MTRRGAAGALLLALAACETPPFAYPPGPPRIVRFTASAWTVAPGAPVTIEWQVEEATEVTLDGEMISAAGSRQLSPAETATHELVAEGPGGRSRALLSIAVALAGAARIERFDAAPPVARLGDRISLRWRTRGATEVRIREVGRRPILDPAPPAGSIEVTIEVAPTHFEISASGAEGTVTTTIAVERIDVPPRILRFDLDPPAILASQSASLSFEVRDAEWTVISSQDQAGRQQILFEAATTQGTLALLGSEGSRTLRLEANNTYGTSAAEARLVVLPIAPPQIARFELSPADSGPGGDVDVAFFTRGAGEVSLESAAGREALPPGASSALARAGAIDTPVILRAVGAGGTATATAILTVDPARPAIARATADPATFRPGEAVVIGWEVEGADWVEIADELGTVLLSTTAPASAYAASPAASTAYRLTAGGPGGQTRRVLPVRIAP